MKTLIDIILPVNHPLPFLKVVGQCFLWSGIAASATALAARFLWHRDKKLGEL